MADISKAKVDNVEYDIKDAVARAAIGDLSALSTEEKSNLVAALNEIAAAASGGACGITYLESDSENPTAMRDIDSGTYVFYGRFKPFAGSSSTINFSSKLLVNVVKQSSASHIMVFYPVNNCVQYLKATDTEYERKNVYLNDLMDDVAALETAVGDLTTLTTTEKTSLVAAINEVAASAGGSSIELDTTMTESGKAADAAAVGEMFMQYAFDLVVTVDPDTMATSHSATEIRTAVSIGQTVVAEYDGARYPLLASTAAVQIFATMVRTDAGKFRYCTVSVLDSTATFEAREYTPPIDQITATVGQIAKVKAVDESGKPTEWEAVDMPSGGSGGSELPAYTEADYGKVLSATADGLVWVEQSGGSGGSVPSAEGVEF